MDDFNTSSVPLFKKIDLAVFERIDKFKATPGYNGLQDFYNSLEEEQQRLFKGVVVFLIFLLPTMFICFMWWRNSALEEDLKTRIALVAKANEIIGQREGLRAVGPAILSPNPIDGESMMSSRLSNLLSSIGMDLAKFQVRNYEGNMISQSVMKSEADFSFTNVSTDELMNMFTALIQREKFRVQSVDIKRNADTNLLSGQFHGIHFSNAVTAGEEE